MFYLKVTEAQECSRSDFRSLNFRIVQTQFLFSPQQKSLAMMSTKGLHGKIRPLDSAVTTVTLCLAFQSPMHGQLMPLVSSCKPTYCLSGKAFFTCEIFPSL